MPTMRKQLLSFLLSIAFVPVIPNASAATATAKPDPALVARYEANRNELQAKLTECKARNDMALILTDVGCMSAEEVINRQQRKMLASKCSSSDTFVFVPGTLKGREREAYLLKNAPSEEALHRCSLTKDQWLNQEMKKAH